MGIVEVSEVAFITFELSGAAYRLCPAYKEGRTIYAVPLTWAQLSDMFLGSLFLRPSETCGAQSSSSSVRGLIVSEYAIQFSELSRHAPVLVSTGRERVRRFIEQLSYDLRFSMAQKLETNTPFQ
nr:uncharacterized protein LOC117275756 [Nicotiana tomentosiformis]